MLDELMQNPFQSEDSRTRNEFKLNGDFAGFLHADVVDGKPTIVDGDKLDFDKIRESCKQVLTDYSFESKAAKDAFLKKVCSLFGFPTTFASEEELVKDAVESFTPSANESALFAINEVQDDSVDGGDDGDESDD